ncbi:uracil-DNA glycosylase family protein [Noviherbaspirillum massiliense]|uniref:uracil-DNA glycosylase family protein n=1 Tax=Noviherbaspirillum massiliense TaxID=1465823 RepID=UPI000317FD16
MKKQSFPLLLSEIRACQVCEAHLPHGPRPVVQASEQATLLIIGQAPGRRVHETGIPWNDPSGDRLREWLNLSRDVFYDERHVAIIPTAFCYPGKGKSGDLPPRPECAPLWHPRLMQALPDIRLTLLVGRYAQEFALGERCKPTLTETVAAFREYLPHYLPLPHPSPRNQSWWKANPWFEAQVLPVLRERTAAALAA